MSSRRWRKRLARNLLILLTSSRACHPLSALLYSRFDGIRRSCWPTPTGPIVLGGQSTMTDQARTDPLSPQQG